MAKESQTKETKEIKDTRIVGGSDVSPVSNASIESITESIGYVFFSDKQVSLGGVHCCARVQASVWRHIGGLQIRGNNNNNNNNNNINNINNNK